MILSALADYYDRRVRQGGDDAPPLFGFATEKVSFAAILTPDGRVKRLEDLRVKDAKGRPQPVPKQVPRPLAGRTSGIRAYFLSDKTQYTLGAGGDKPTRDAQAFAASRDKHLAYLDGSDDPGAVAVRRFFETWDPSDAATLDHWDEAAGSNLVFKLDGTPGFIHDRPVLRDIWQRRFAEENDARTRQCLVSGESAPAAMLHPAVKGVPGAQSSGAYLVSFNAEAFCSYGQGVADKGLNAPVSQERAFAYTTALNDLLRRDSGHKLQLGETTVVFWADKDTPFETVLPAMFGGNRDTSGLSEAARARLDGTLQRIEKGLDPLDDLSDAEAGLRFYILGLATPSQARLTVRFWLVTTLGHLLAGIRDHVAALQIERRFEKEPATPSIWRLIAETAQDRDLNNAVPGLHAGLLRAVLTGGPYPAGLLGRALERIRVECGKSNQRDDPVNHTRAALIKAVLIRRAPDDTRPVPPEVTRMSLDTESTDIPYRLGRLFAAMEKAQQDAQGQNLNRTLRDSYFATASAAPRSVFPRLLRLTQHHISKANYGSTSDRRIAAIVEEMTMDDAFPPQLTLEEQGRFVLGYYHQRNAFYRKTGQGKPDVPESDTQTTEEEAA
jgi:CRISPR-associated protein Csd1